MEEWTHDSLFKGIFAAFPACCGSRCSRAVALLCAGRGAVRSLSLFRRRTVRFLPCRRARRSLWPIPASNEEKEFLTAGTLFLPSGKSSCRNSAGNPFPDAAFSSADGNASPAFRIAATPESPFRSEADDWYWTVPLPCTPPSDKVRNMLRRAAQEVDTAPEPWGPEAASLAAILLTVPDI